MATTATTTATLAPMICEPGGSGMFVPLFGGDDEGNWNKSGRAVLYGFIMVYCFLGAAIVSDFFMSAIEAITSKKGRRVIDHDRKHVLTYFVWNDTVANLTLLALGSSAPEILLSIVEVIKLDFKAGDLGPSTIVGSAAFNTLCIISVAILAIPNGGVRFIKGVRVYHVTVVFNILAYIWLLIIVEVNSKDVVDLEEGIATLLLFLLLVVLAFITSKYEEKKIEQAEHAAHLQEAAAEADKFTQQDSISAIELHFPKKKVRKLLSPHLRLITMHRALLAEKATNRMTSLTHARLSQTGGGRYSVSGPENGLSKAGGLCGLTDSIATIVQKCPPAGDNGHHILDEDDNIIINKHGVLTFLCDQIEVKGCMHDTTLAVPVLRRNGAHGLVTCQWKTERLDAVPNCDYQEAHGVLVFPPGNVCQEVFLTILPQRLTERSESFQLVLDSPEGDAEFNPNDDGKDSSAIMTVTIVNALDEEAKLGVGSLIYNALVDPELIKYGCELWKEQISDALNAAGDSDEPASFADMAMHVISLPWKLTFAFLAPPPVFCGGWVLFVVALGFIGGLTAFIADLAETFGCCMGWANSVTAIIVVAPGTSLPDLFASQAAALADENADASIVNVTGSNSVNVFLGIGLPWTMAAIYWKVKGEIGVNPDYVTRNPDIVTRYPNGAFIVEAGSLSFSVIIFTSVSVICLGSLRIKRHFDGGELGGNSFLGKQALAGMLLFMWVWYLAWNILESTSDDADISQWISMSIAGVFILVVSAIEVGAHTGSFQSKCPNFQRRGSNIDAQPLIVSSQQLLQAKSAAKVASPSGDSISGTSSEGDINLPTNVVGKAREAAESNGGDSNGSDTTVQTATNTSNSQDPAAKSSPKKKKRPSGGGTDSTESKTKPQSKARIIPELQRAPSFKAKAKAKNSQNSNINNK